MWEKATETQSSKPQATVGGLIEGNEYQFRVFAVNKAGLSEPSEPSKTFIAKPRFLAPKIDRRNLREITLSVGTMLRLDVNVTGEPAPKTDWRFHSAPLNSSRHVEVINVEYNTKLIVRPLTRDDRGEYEIVAVNSSGRDQATVTVNITDKPGAPEGPLEAFDIHNEGCKLKWKRPKDDGGCPIEYYQIDKMDPETGCWVPCARSTEPQADVQGLITGREYKFRVAAINAEGESTPLEMQGSIIAKNPFDEPGKPGNLRPTDWDKDHVDLQWTPPESDGGSPITSYIVEKKDKYGQWEKAVEVPADQCKATVPDLIENQTYEFRVRAINAAGPGEASDATLPITAKPRNQAPRIDRTNLIDVRIKAGQNFSFDVNVTGEPAPTTKWFNNKREMKSNDRVKIHHVDYNTRINVRMGTRAEAGVYTITAENENGKDSADVNVVILDKPSPPGGPLRVEDIYAEGATLKWNAPEDDGGQPIDSYIVEKMDEATGRWVPAGETNGPKCELAVDGLTPGHKYKFRVRAVNKQGKSEPLVALQAIEAKNPFDQPSKPGTPEIRDYDTDFVELAWTRPESDGGSPITGYVIEKKDKYSPDWEKCVEIDGDVTSGRVPDLIEGNKYEFRVRAVNKAGPGTPSNPTDTHIARPKNQAPRIDRNYMIDVKIKAGQNFEFTIPVHGEPPPSKEWTHKDNTLFNTDRIKIQNEDYSTRLRIYDSKRSDAGKYLLTIKNVNGTDSATVNVTVLDVPLPPEGPIKHDNVTKNAATLHWRHPKDDGGSEITHYIVEKLDTDQLRWVPVGETVQLQIRADNLIEGHSYQFRVRAVNKQGESQPLATQTPIVAKDPFGKPDKPGQPKVLDWDKDHVDIEWTPPKKDGGAPITGYIIEKKPRFGNWEKACEVSNFKPEARIPNLKEGEEYEFRVIAVNKGGPGEPSEPSAAVVCKPRFVVPHFDKALLQDLVVHAGKRIYYNIPVEASPRPTFEWRINNKKIESDQRVHQQLYNNDITFEIPYSLRSDTGLYTLVVKNELGEFDASANVTVLDRPSPPKPELEISNITKDGCSLKWNMPEDDGGSPILHYVVEKMDMSRGTWTDAGMSSCLVHEVQRLVYKKQYLFRVKAVNAIGESEPLEARKHITAKNMCDEPDAPGKPKIMDWDKDHVDLMWTAPKHDGGSPIEEYIIQRKEKGSPYWVNAVHVAGKQTCGTVPELTEGQEYEFRIVAVNNAGESEPSEPSDTVIARCRHLAPKIITPLNEIRIKAGLIFHIDIDFIGEPAPEVEWTNTGKSVVTNERTTLTAIGHHTIVHTVNCKREDSGKYKLFLKNDSGTDEGEFQLIVLDRPGPPTGPLHYEEITAQSVTLSWKPPRDNGGSEITGYVIEKRDLTHGGGWVPAVTYVNPKNTHSVVPRLLEGTEYEFRVLAENLQGRSDPLNCKNSIVAKNQFTVPGAPGKPELVDSDRDHIKITWKQPITTGGSPIQGYIIERRDKQSGRWLQLNNEPVPNIEYNDDRVTDGHQYDYRVRAVNAAGPGQPSDHSNLFTARPIKEAPKLHLDHIIGRKIKVRAGEPVNIDIQISGSPKPTIEWSKNDVPVTENHRLTTESNAERTKLNIGHSNRNDSGKYTVAASNEFGTEKADIEVLVVDRPSPPEGPLTYTEVTQDYIALAWNPPLDDGGSDITGYVVEMNEYGTEMWRPVPGYCPKCAFTVKGLFEGKKYQFRVKAENMYGISDELEGKAVIAKSPYDPPDPPSQPEIVSYTPNTCTIQWLPPNYSGGKPISGYIVEKRERGAEWLRVNTYPTPNTTYTIQDLIEGNKYEFRVRAVNEAGPSKPSKPSETIMASLQRTRPGAPDPPKADRITKDSVTLSWRPPRSDGKSKIRGYTVQFRPKTGGSGEWKNCNEDPTPNLGFTVPNLTEGEEYSFRIIAHNDIGASEPSRSLDVVINEQPNKPMMDLFGVRDITVRAGEDFNIFVPYVGFPKPTATWFFNDNQMDEDIPDERKHQQLTDDSCSFIVKNSKRSDTGQYRLQLRNPSGFDTATINVKVLDRPGKPENLRADEFAGDSLTLFWNPPKDNGGAPVTNYVVEKRLTRSLDWSKVSSYCTTPFVRIRNLEIGRDYEFRVMAENQYGQSDPAVTDQPIRARHPFDPPGAPGIPKGIDTSEDSITLEWTKPRSDGGAPITNYVIEKRLVSEDKWTKATNSSVTDTQFKVTGLIENHDYEFRIAAVNAAGQGPWSQTSDVICARAAPIAPKITSDLSIRDMTVIAGEEFKIIVPYIGNPKPYPTWTFNGVDVDQDERIKFDHTQASATIYLNKCSKRSDTGNYTIHLINNVGKDSASCRVLVVDKPQPPQGPLDVSDITPDSCTLTWRPPLDDGGSPITNYVVERLDPIGIWVKVSSFVRNVHYDVMGLETNKKYLFRVRAENQYGQSAPLTMDEAILATFPFSVPDPPSPPRVIDWDTNCVTLTWDKPFNDGGSRIQGYKMEYRDVAMDKNWRLNDFLIKDCTYQMYNLFPGAEYEFRVRAKNAAGLSKPSASSNQFKMKEKFKIPSPPGQPAVVKVGKNYVDLKWSKPQSDGGSRITGYIIERRDLGGAVWVKCNDYNVTDTEYTVSNLIEFGDYEFRIYAVNAAGKSEPSSCTTPIKVCEVLGGEKPDWVKRLQYTLVPLGKHVCLECEAHGTPEPTCRWLRNGREISTGGRYKAEQKNGVFKLYISDCSYSDEGDYTCEAHNSLGFVHTSAHLKVGVPPRINTMPEDLYLAEGNNRKIKIFYSGDQPMEVKLIKDHITVTESDHMKFTIFDDYIIISIRDITKDDAGSYVLSLKNDSGAITGKFDVFITGLPGPPIGPLGISGISKHICTLTWKPPSYDGGLRITHYVVERRDITSQHWLVVSSNVKECQTIVQGLTENQEYVFRVMAVNENGIGLPLEGANPIRAKEPFDRPGPPGTPKVLEVGGDFVNLEWEKPLSDGGSKIQGYWIDKRETGSDTWQRVNVSLCLPTTINCSNLIEGRQYEFRVFAQNAAGLSQESTASTSVKIVDPEVAKPPEVVRPLNSVSCVQNRNAEFSCKITGVPKPKITWYKGAREIVSGSRYHIYSDGDVHYLVIHDVFGEDADEYQCRAVNKGGVKSTKGGLVIKSK
jgi:predicted phage tail protein